MFRLSKKLMFAIEAVVDIAHHGAGQPVQSAEITQRQGIPRRYLEQVLQHLVRSGLLEGVRGPKGGYRLARERRLISLGEIVRVVAQLEPSAEAQDSDSGSRIAVEVVRPVWEDLRTEAMQTLDGISVEALCQQARRSGIDVPQTPLDYVI